MIRIFSQPSFSLDDTYAVSSFGENQQQQHQQPQNPCVVVVGLPLDQAEALEPAPLNCSNNHMSAPIEIVDQVSLNATFKTKQAVEETADFLGSIFGGTLGETKHATAPFSVSPLPQNTLSMIQTTTNQDSDSFDSMIESVVKERATTTRSPSLLSLLSKADYAEPSPKRRRVSDEDVHSSIAELFNDDSLWDCSTSATGRKGDDSFQGDDEVRFRSFQTDMWFEKFEELVTFHAKHGHCVPTNESASKDLNDWVKRQRYQQKLKTQGRRSTMTEKRKEMLDSLGFTWDLHDAAWEERFQHLVEFHRQNGHCNVPSTYPPNPSLGIWVKGQRHQYKKFLNGRRTTLTQPRIARLNKMGFAWNFRGRADL